MDTLYDAVWEINPGTRRLGKYSDPECHILEDLVENRGPHSRFVGTTP